MSLSCSINSIILEEGNFILQNLPRKQLRSSCLAELAHRRTLHVHNHSSYLSFELKHLKGSSGSMQPLPSEGNLPRLALALATLWPQQGLGRNARKRDF